jgi:hypothetical protein
MRVYPTKGWRALLAEGTTDVETEVGGGAFMEEKGRC